jgi:hypothetical protein
MKRAVQATLVVGVSVAAIAWLYVTDVHRLRDSALWGTPAWNSSVGIGLALGLVAPIVIFVGWRRGRDDSRSSFGRAGLAYSIAMTLVFALTHSRGGRQSPADNSFMVIALTATLGAFVALGLLPVIALVSHVVGRRVAVDGAVERRPAVLRKKIKTTTRRRHR